jgi:hypothetical protein
MSMSVSAGDEGDVAGGSGGGGGGGSHGSPADRSTKSTTFGPGAELKLPDGKLSSAPATGSLRTIRASPKASLVHSTGTASPSEATTRPFVAVLTACCPSLPAIPSTFGNTAIGGFAELVEVIAVVAPVGVVGVCGDVGTTTNANNNDTAIRPTAENAGCRTIAA